MEQRELPWLKNKWRLFLKLLEEGVSRQNFNEIKKTLVEIAAIESPSSAIDRAREAAILLDIPTESAGKATRWLAMIRRDYGQEAFDQIIAER